MISAFPRAGRRVEHAYAELDLAAGGGTQQQRSALGDPRLLARPWDPATCVDPPLRGEIWQWLEQVVTWLNQEYVWDADAMIPSCWPRHPHLVHELAVIADLRRRAGLALTADALEEWHRYALPAFTDRMRQRLRKHCLDGGHQAWPGLGRYITQSLFNADMNAVLGGTLVVGAVFIGINAFCDFLYKVFDPRLRTS